MVAEHQPRHPQVCRLCPLQVARHAVPLLLQPVEAVMAARAVQARLRLPQQPDDGDLGALRVHRAAAHQEPERLHRPTASGRPARRRTTCWNGLWGLLRSYNGLRRTSSALPDNPNGRRPISTRRGRRLRLLLPPKSARSRALDVTAVTAASALPAGRLVYNSRTDGPFGALSDPTSILYVRTRDLDPSGTAQAAAQATARIEPLVLRARAGECIKFTLAQPLRNRSPTSTATTPCR